MISRSYDANYGKIDNRGYAKASFFFDIMQDIATVHAEMMTLGPSQFPIIWVLSRMRLSLTRPVLPYERVRCETWCTGIRGVSWYRTFIFYVEDEAIGEAESMWVTLSPETHKIMRPSSFEVAAAYMETSISGMPDALPKLSSQGAVSHHMHEVRYSDLDVNNHLNNVKIVDIVCDTLDLQQSALFVSTLQINFLQETTCGESLQLLQSNVSTQERIIAGRIGDDERFTAYVTLAPTN